MLVIWKRKIDIGLRRRSDNRVDMVEKTCQNMFYKEIDANAETLGRLARTIVARTGRRLKKWCLQSSQQNVNLAVNAMRCTWACIICLHVETQCHM